MIQNLFNIPSRYFVNKSIEKNSFIKKANLSKAEKRELDKQVLSVNIIYNFFFYDIFK